MIKLKSEDENYREAVLVQILSNIYKEKVIVFFKTKKQCHRSAIIMSFIAGQYNRANLEDKTMLAEMIDYGKTYYLVSELLPCVPENIIIG